LYLAARKSVGKMAQLSASTRLGSMFVGSKHVKDANVVHVSTLRSSESIFKVSHAVFYHLTHPAFFSSYFSFFVALHCQHPEAPGS